MMIQEAGYDPKLIDWTEVDAAMRADIAEQLVQFRHMLYVSLAMLFLLRLRLQFKKNSDADLAPGPASVGCVP